MLKLKHTLTVNPAQNPANPNTDEHTKAHPKAHPQTHINAAQLWNGLMMRVLDPMRFNSNIDQAQVKQIDDTHYQRTLHFGAQGIQDNVRIEPQHSVQYTTTPTQDTPQGQLRYSIHNDTTQGLQLICEYETQFPEPTNPEEQQLLEMVKSAYCLADEEMLDIIRADAHMVRH
jgi:Domain of unknown function (DUF1857)